LSGVLSLALAAVLAAIAALHLYWGFGGFWPGTDEASLVDMVVGARPGSPMPSLLACTIVAGCLLVSALSVLVVGGKLKLNLPPLLNWIPAFAFWFSCVVFLARGIITYALETPAFAAGTRFIALNQQIYSPLGIVIGATFLAIRFLPKT
jgi:hypothetical protein